MSCARPFHARRVLAHARFADEHGIVLGAPGQNLNNPLDLSIPADYRIQLALAGCLGQIRAILGKGGRLLLSPALFLGPFLLHVAHVPECGCVRS